VSATVLLPVNVRTSAFEESIVTVVECGECYALVREGMLADHFQRAHPSLANEGG
jgi:hypothetical protein